MAGSAVLTVLALTAPVSTAAEASPVGWAAEAERRKGAAATTSTRPSAAQMVRRDDAFIVWEGVADMGVLLLGRRRPAGGPGGSLPGPFPVFHRHLVALR